MKANTSLNDIFKMTDHEQLLCSLRDYLSSKQYEHKQPLTEDEHMFYCLARMGRDISSSGFSCLFSELYSPEYFTKICDSLAEVEALELRDLLLEAWGIYTNGKRIATMDELMDISPDNFNTDEKMNRFDEIGDEVMTLIQQQFADKKICAVVYAQKHRENFVPIKND